MKRAYLDFGHSLAGFLVLWILLTSVIAPRGETWALAKIQSYSDSSLPVRIRAQSLHLKFFKPSASLQGIEIEGQGELAEALKTARIRSMRVYVDFFHSVEWTPDSIGCGCGFSGSGSEYEIAFSKSKGPAKELPMDELFSLLEKVPLERVFLQNIRLKVSSQDLKLNATANGGDLLITDIGKNLTAKANLPDLQVQFSNLKNFQGSLDTHLYLTRQSLRIMQLGMRLDDSELCFSES